MSFWQNLLTAAGIGSALPWVALAFIVAALILFALVPGERLRLRTAVVLFLLSIIGLCVAATILYYGYTDKTTAYRWIRWFSRFIQGVTIINVTSVLVFNVVLDAVNYKPPRIARDLLVALAYIILAIYLLSSSGVDLTGIIATSAVITAVIGFSLQDTLGNIMGGMALQMERTIHVGDWVRIDQQEGRVKEIRWRQTSIETRNWDTVVIPNSVLMKGQVTLLGRREGAPRQRRLWVYFNVDFRYAPTDVIDAVETALRAEPIPNIAADPPPNCILFDFKDSYAAYAVRYWLTDIAVDDPTNSVVRSRIYFALRRAGVPLSIPAQSVFLTEDDDARRERKRNEETERRTEALRRVEIFHTLTDDERRELAGHLKIAPFVRGEAMTRQGAAAHWLYILTRGEAEVQVEVDHHNEKVATLHEGDFFGEMGLMTGEPRRATVVAQTDAECYRLDKDAFNDVLRRRAEIAEDISHVLARRRVELDAVREQLNEEAMRERMRHTQRDLLHRIRNFFTLEQSNS
ncbi:MAG: cyclic nucleotide-binding domain-containing protein [Pyrinomonadaceae bacterium]